MTASASPQGETPVASRLAALDWDFTDASTDSLTHSLHPYPAKFIPQIPRRLITELTHPGDLVVDPFSGSGTVALECLVTGRDFVGIDANPLAPLLGRVKTTPLSSPQMAEALAFVAEPLEPVKEWESWVPAIPNIDKWFDPRVTHQLALLRRAVERVEDRVVADLLLIAFSRVVGAVSFQESETRYVSQPRQIEPDEVMKRMASAVRTACDAISNLPREGRGAEFVHGDAREVAAWGSVSDNSVELVVTSPPYPNAYDYHLYHRFRLFWLGFDPGALRRVEIGSHLTNQRSKDPVGKYEAGMSDVLRNMQRVLKPAGRAAFIVGDGVHHGTVYDTAAALSELAAKAGFDVEAVIDRQLPSRRRSVTVAGRRLKTEQVVLLRKSGEPPEKGGTLRLMPPSYERHEYEADLATREALEILRPQTVQAEPDGSLTVIEPAHPELADRLTFHHCVVSAEGERPTIQSLSEGSGRKNSTYASHGIHKYRGKFYPQLARVLLNLSGTGPGSLVLDPFGGSGTTATEAILLGANAVSVDWNPLAVQIAKAKLDAVKLRSDALSSVGAAWSSAAVVGDGVDWQQFSDAVHDELESWFPQPVLAKLSHLLAAVRNAGDPRIVRIGEVLVSDLVRDVSQQEPRDLRVRRRAEPLDDADVEGAFRRRFDRLVSALDEFRHRREACGDSLGTAEVVSADISDDSTSLDPHLEPGSVDAVVTSPPYATALPYLDTDRLSLALVLGLSSRERRRLEDQLIGSRELGARELRDLQAHLEALDLDGLLPPSTSEFLASLQEDAMSDPNAGFRRRQKPAALYRYFVGMARTLARLRPLLRPGASAWFVVGDSRTKLHGEFLRIPTTEELAAIAKHLGYDVEESIPITVTRDGLVHARHRITENAMLHLRA